jgi:3-isopropylmalate dehydrogenase
LEALITLLPGDGIGPEVTECTQQVLEAVASKFDHSFRFDTQLIGVDETAATGTTAGSNCNEL